MDFDKSRIERLKRDLYSRDEKRVPQEKRGIMHGRDTGTDGDGTVPHEWGPAKQFDVPWEAREEAAYTPMSARKKNTSFFSSFLGISLIFFCVSLGIAIFIFFGGLNMISSNNVDIKITGPSSVASGDELDADVSIVNQNRTDLLNPTLYIDYPSGTQSVSAAVGGSVPLTHDQVTLSTIAVGKHASYSLRTIFFGETNTVKTVTFRLEYTVKGSTAVFSKTKTYDISIGSSPLILHVGYPTSINSGQPVTLSIDLTSNSTALLPDTMVKVTYPYGFTYTSSNIKPLNANNGGSGLWDVGDLQNGDKKTLNVVGTLVGQDNESRAFQVSVGTKSTDPTQDFNAQLAASTATVTISKSFFGLSVTGPGGSSQAVSNTGQSVSATIAFQNTLPDKIIDNTVKAVFSGNVFNRASVSADDNGYYRSADNTVLWDKTGNSTLAQISPGDGGRVSFSVASLPDPAIVRSIKNPHIDVAVTMSGTRVSATSATQITSTANMTIRLQSVLGLSARSFRSVGPFTNTGPIPPVHDTQSTYTITWTLTNTSNDVANTTASAVLPQNVVWLGQTDPASERISYDPNTRTVSWNVGLVSNGTGFIYSPKTVSFQVGLTPSITNIGSSLPLVSAVQASGTDTYASTTLYAQGGSVDTRYSDPGFLNGNDIVK